MTMATLTRSVTVNAPVEKVFDYAMDVRNLWSFPGEALALADVTLTPEGVGTSARIWTHWLGFHIEGGLEYTEVVRPEKIVVEVGFAVEHPTWTLTFKPFHGGTKVTGGTRFTLFGFEFGSETREPMSRGESWFWGLALAISGAVMVVHS